MSKHKRIGSLAKIRRGASPRPIGDPKYFGGDVGWVRIVDVTRHNYKYLQTTEQYLSKLGQSKSVVVNQGDLIMSICATVGKPIIVDMAACIHDGFVQFYDLSGIDTEYLFYQLQFHEKDFVKCAQPGTQINLNTQIVQNEKIFVPQRISTQSKITAVLRSVDQAIQKTEALIQKYQQIKQGLMHDLFTRGVTPDGKLRPHRGQAPELYKETLIGWMPLQWDVVHVHDLCSDVVDCPHSTPVYKDHGIPCIRTADMAMGQLLTEQAYKVDYKTYLKRVQRLIPRNGDIIYSREGERLGIASPVRKEIVCLGQRVMLLRPLHETDPNFLLWSMNLPTFYRQVVSGLGATTSPHVNVGDIKKIMTCRPPKKEQEMIGKLIAAVQIKLEKEENFKNKLLLKKSGLMHDLLTGTVKVKVDE